MEINRDIMKKVNKVPHRLAHKEYSKQRDAMVTECKKMLTAGKSRIEVAAYLEEVEARGGQISGKASLLDRLAPAFCC